MSKSEVKHDYGTLTSVVKKLRAQGMSQQAIENVLRVYGVKV